MMCRIVVITSLFIVCISLAGNSQTDTIRLDQIEISASRLPVIYSMEVRPVSMIDRQAIRALPVRDMEELLKYAAGFDIRQRGVNGAQADISARGGSFEQTLILLNGTRINDPQTGHHNLDLPVELDQVERIELLRGPGTRLYGTNAFTGAMNIVTSSEGPGKLRISASGGDFGLFAASAAGNFSTGKLSHYVSAGGKICEGYMRNTDFRCGRAFYHGVFRSGSERVELQAGYLNKSFGANSFYSAKYPDQFESTRAEFASLKANVGRKIRVSPSVYWRRHHDRFELFRDQPPAWYKGHNYHMTDILGGELNACMDTRAGRTAAGTEIRYEHIFSNILGNLLNDTIAVPGEKNEFFSRSADRRLLSVFIDHQYSIKRLTLGAGVLLHYSDDFGWGFYPGLDMGLDLLKGFKAFISMNRALRLPTFTDLYYQGPANIGNPGLKPEESWDLESGLKWERPFASGYICGFYRLGYHLIDWVRFPGETVWHSANLSSINAAGIELDVNIWPGKLFSRKLFIERIVCNYSFTDLSKANNEDLISYYVMDYLKHKAVITMQHRIWKNTGASWGVSIQDRAGTYSDPATGNEEKYEPFATIDGRVFWDIRKLSLYISVSNITNTAIRDFGAIPLPGRWLVCGLRIEIQ